MSPKMFVFGVISTALLQTALASAEVIVDIGGTQLTHATSVNIAGDYGPNCPSPSTSKAITITPKSAGSGNARVEILDDGTIDYLRMYNAKITANCAVSDFRIAFAFNHAVEPTVVSPDEIRFKYYGAGNLIRTGTTPPPGAYVKTKASYRNSPPSPPATSYNSGNPVGSEQTRTTYTWSTSGLTSNLTNLTNPRGLQAEFTFTLPAAADVLNMTQFFVQDYPAAGGGSGVEATDNSYQGGVLNIFLLTAWTSQTTGCPQCVIADNSSSRPERAKLFVRNNMDSLSQDLASGQGEYLASVAALLRVPASEQPAFFSLAQDRYARLVSEGAMTPEQLLMTLEQIRQCSEKDQG